jgi:murein DD-endopeptidase MepM/ murein hydrolase activator NlpD
LLERLHPILKVARPHSGVDISAAWGSPIFTPAAGLVVSLGTEGGYGNLLVIDHGGGVVTRYAHCSQFLVRIGQYVQRGDPVALVGETGLSTGPHLHYELVVNGRRVDPEEYGWN